MSSFHHPRVILSFQKCLNLLDRIQGIPRRSYYCWVSSSHHRSVITLGHSNHSLFIFNKQRYRTIPFLSTNDHQLSLKNSYCNQHGSRCIIVDDVSKNRKSKPFYSSTSSSSSTDTVLPQNEPTAMNHHHHPESTTITTNKGGHVSPKQPRTIFPWRHSSSVLSRIHPNSIEYITQGGILGPHMPPLPTWTQNVLWMTSCRALGISFYDMILSKQSQTDLSYAFVHAFQQAVNGLLIQTFHAPIEMVETKDSISENEDDDDSLDNFPIQIDQLIQPSPSHYQQQEQTSSSSSSTTTLSSLDKKEEDNVLDIHTMLDKNLYNLYEACYQHHHHQLYMKLFCKPIRGTILSLNFIPFLTRKEVYTTPSLRHTFTNLYKHLDTLQQNQEVGKKLSFYTIFRETFHTLEQMGLQQIQHTTRGVSPCIQCTVIAQVLITCNEIFHIKDLSFNETIQGDAEEKIRTVVHLVRFEIVVNIDAETGIVSLGQWQITDWDDLLDGNIFYQ